MLVLVDDDLLMLNRTVGVLRRRNLPFNNLSIGPSPMGGVARMTVILTADATAVELMVNQLRKTDGVRQAICFRSEDVITREMALIQVRPPHERYAEVLDLITLYSATVVDEPGDAIVVEVSGSGPFVLSLIRALESFGIVDVARTGAIALPRERPNEVPCERKDATAPGTPCRSSTGLAVTADEHR